MIARQSEPSRSILANDHLDPAGSIVQSGANLAEAVCRARAEDGQVVVSFREFKALSSSYFNEFLRRVADSGRLSDIGAAIRLDFTSATHELVFSRSLEAMRLGTIEPTDASVGQGI